MKKQESLFRLSTIFIYLLLVLLVPAILIAEQPYTEVEKKTHSISGQILSPFCPGRTLNDCPSSAASDLRNKISDMLSQGKSEEQVLEELYSTYGEEVRALPKKEGFGLFAWLTPPIFLLTGLLVFYIWLKRHSSQESPVSDTASNTIDPDIMKKIEKEVAEN